MDRRVSHRKHEVQSGDFSGEGIQIDERIGPVQIMDRRTQFALGRGQLIGGLAILQIDKLHLWHGEDFAPEFKSGRALSALRRLPTGPP